MFWYQPSPDYHKPFKPAGWENHVPYFCHNFVAHVLFYTLGTQPGALAAGDVSIIERENHDTNKHQQAESALLTIRHKLRGYELNSQLSVSGQVEYLIQQATDHNNLCKMFVGWQPYLWYVVWAAGFVNRRVNQDVDRFSTSDIWLNVGNIHHVTRVWEVA